MKYEVGDKVVIRTWEDMEKEYGLNNQKAVACHVGFDFIVGMEEKLNEEFPDRILTIKKKIDDDNNSSSRHYLMEEIEHFWVDNMIECLSGDYEEVNRPIDNRFEILDLRK